MIFLFVGEKPYKCDVCNEHFARSDVLCLHKRSKHGILPPPRPNQHIKNNPQYPQKQTFDAANQAANDLVNQVWSYISFSLSRFLSLFQGIIDSFRFWLTMTSNWSLKVQKPVTCYLSRALSVGEPVFKELHRFLHSFRSCANLIRLYIYRKDADKSSFAVKCSSYVLGNSSSYKPKFGPTVWHYLTSAISKQRTLKNIQVLDFSLNTKYYLSSLIWYQIYYSTIKITIATGVWRIALKKVHFEKTPFETQHFGNWDKKHEDQILLLFLKGA